MGDGARSVEARSRPEFWSPASQRSWMLEMRWSTGVRGRRGGGRGGAIGAEERRGRGGEGERGRGGNSAPGR